MLSRSAAFDTAITNGAPVVVTAYTQRGGIVQTYIDLLPGATVALDDTAPSRRTFSGQIADDGTLGPHLPTDPLAPYALELVVMTGLILPDGTQEDIPVGVFRLNVVQDDTTGNLQLSGPDRSAVVAGALNESPYQIVPGTPLDVAIGNYLAAKFPSLPFVADGGAHAVTTTTNIVYHAGQATGDPWSNMMDLATDFGRELYIDANGTAQLRPIPDPTTWPVSWIYKPGQANLAISGTHIIDTSQAINVAVVTSSGTGIGSAITGSFEITDPTSPIYPDPDGFGRRPTFYQASHLTTQDACDYTAEQLVNSQIGSFDQVQMTAIPHPCHEPSDVVNYSSNLLGMSLPLVLSAWTLQVDLQAPNQYTTRTAGAQAETVLQDLINAGGTI